MDGDNLPRRSARKRKARRLDESVYAPVLKRMPNGNTVEGGSRADSDTNTDGLADQFAIIDTDHNNKHRPVSAEHGNATTTPNTASSAIVPVHVVLDTSGQSAVAAPGSSTERTIFPASGEQLQSAGPSSKPYTAQITDGMQVTPNTTIGRNGGSPSTMKKDDRSANKFNVEPPSNGQVKRAGEVTLKMDMSLLNCRVCSRPIKPPVFQCNAGHVACGRCLVELPGEQCQTCEHGGGFSRCPTIDAVVSSLTVMCGHDGCGSDVPYNELDDHQSACQYAPCFCMEPGCGFFGAPLALLSHMGALHAMPVHKVHYGKVHRFRVLEPGCLLHGQGDDSVFLLAVGAIGMATVVSVVCIRAGVSSWPQYAVKLRANCPPPPSSIEGSILLDMKPVTSSTRPGEVALMELPSFLGVPPTYLVGSGASKEVSLDVHIDRM
ncbi:hypothetical protein CFC21_039019 [Triticum aestivum]|uniref:RING-type E3 ubiquitin transferase n=2 Tax=Triticum aestivum TaxID=4565 RepID=A0A9R1JRG1_WHEAT|nr:uncharacterized protein LOC123064320 isoform X1 [Triticum aestivum]KAF7026935.1 hypothetical protein CFC21_039019 [Triticum aestivum]